MIGFLQGFVQWKADNKIIINTGGTGYLVNICHSERIPKLNEEIELYIYTYVRDDAFDLYGFFSMEERELFSTLLSVSRVGPRAGVNILSTLTYDEFINAILMEKIAVLKQVSGIGPKTARRLILELQSKVEELSQQHGSFQEDNTGQTTGEDLYQALMGLGYSRQEITKAVKELEFAENISLEDKIKMVLSYFGRESL